MTSPTGELLATVTASVARIRAVLADAPRHAERRGLVGRNVATLAVLPACKPAAERRSLTPDEGRALLAAAAGDRVEALVVCGLLLGLRPGELTGLLWSDLDAEVGTLAVSGSLKRENGPDGGQVLRRGEAKRSRAGQRTIVLPLMLAEALRAHRARQAAERLAAGSVWSDAGLITATTATASGRTLTPPPPRWMPCSVASLRSHQTDSGSLAPPDEPNQVTSGCKLPAQNGWAVEDSNL